MLKSVSAVALAVALTAAPALAADKSGAPAIIPDLAPSGYTTSCYVQGLTGGSVVAVNPDSSVIPTSLSTQGWTIGAGLGCDLKMERFVVGALARIETPITSSGSLIDSDYSWMAAIRAGYMINTGLLAYGLVGYEGRDLSIAGIGLDKDGLLVGGGLEIMLGKHFSLTTEYTYAGLGSSNALGTPVDTESHKVRVGISYRFTSIFGD